MKVDSCPTFYLILLFKRRAKKHRNHISEITWPGPLAMSRVFPPVRLRLKTAAFTVE